MYIYPGADVPDERHGAADEIDPYGLRTEAQPRQVGVAWQRHPLRVIYVHISIYMYVCIYIYIYM